MKKSLVILLASSLLISTEVLADQASNTPTISTTPSSSSSSGKKSKKKKATLQATATVTASSPTPAPSVPSPTPTAAPMKKSSSGSSFYSSNIQLYDRLGAPGDLRQALSLAANAAGPSPKHERSLFLWLGKLVGGDQGKMAYLRLSVEGIELGGAKKPWIVITGTVSDQSGSDSKAGDAVEVAVDFRDIKVDYEGTKLGEVQKGNDIADQVYDILITHPAYDWVVLGDSQLRDSQSMGMKPAFLVKARDGYAFMEPIESHR